MMQIKRMLLRAPAAMTPQLRGMEFATNDVYQRVPDARKDLKKDKPQDNSKMSYRDRCWMSLRRSDFKCRSDPEFNVGPFIDAQKRCLKNPCATSYPPSDLRLYRPTDKLNRKYQRTWRECEVTKRKRKAVCRSRPISYRRRSRPSSLKRCPKSGLNLGLGQCLRTDRTPCPRFKLPLCKEANRRGCYAVRPHSGCARPRTKYPSYSECRVDPVPPAAPNHCTCINKPPMCEVWAYYRMKKS